MGFVLRKRNRFHEFVKVSGFFKDAVAVFQVVLPAFEIAASRRLEG